ncbi:MAG: DoxX family protein [Deltaproteobacteria bacterium]|nr:DoxX family protein [Deltaproteobacteria bacterium]
MREAAAVAAPDKEAGSLFSLKWEGISAFLAHFLKWGLALLFIFAGVVKLRDPKAFAQAISQYGLVPDGLVPVLALGLPGAEVLAGLGLLVNARGSLGAILVMLLMFIGVLGYAIAADLDIDCGCFTAAELAARGSVKAAFFQDLGFLAGALFLRWRRRFGGGGQGK